MHSNRCIYKVIFLCKLYCSHGRANRSPDIYYRGNSFFMDAFYCFITVVLKSVIIIMGMCFKYH